MNDNPLEKAVGLNGKQIGGMLIRPPKTKVNSKHPSRLAAVYDMHHNPIRGLWFRLPHGPWVAQISHGGSSTKVKLAATTFPKAKEEHQRLKIQSKDGTLSAVGKSPNFTSYAQDYMNSITNEAKKCDSTIRAEKSRIVWWQNYLGTIPLNKISLATVRKGMAKLKTEGNRNRQLSDRSLNYYVTGINNVLNRAVEEGWLPSSPIPPKSLHRKLRKGERAFVTEHEFKRLRESALAVCPRNGRQVSDLISLLQYAGSRIGVTLKLRWIDVDWKNKQLIIARDGSSKGKTSRRVEFNPLLEQHLKEMYSRRLDDTWLFPSGQRGNEGRPAQTFYPTLTKAREHAGLGKARERDGLKAVGFHDCRHFFCSYAIMKGIDYKTIAEWVGHVDGGLLVAKIYGHLNPEHKRAAALKFNSSPTVIEGGLKVA